MLWRSLEIILLRQGVLYERLLKLCDVVNRFLRKPFWFFQSIFSILGSMRLNEFFFCFFSARAEASVWLNLFALRVLVYSSSTLGSFFLSKVA